MSTISEWDYKILVGSDFTPNLDFISRTKKLTPEWQNDLKGINKQSDVTLSQEELLIFLNRMGTIAIGRAAIFNRVTGTVMGRQGLRKRLSVYEDYKPNIACAEVKYEQTERSMTSGSVRIWFKHHARSIKRCNMITMKAFQRVHNVHIYLRPDGETVKKPKPEDMFVPSKMD